MVQLSDQEWRRLEGKLLEQLRQDCKESERIGYSPREFRAMLTDVGPIMALPKGNHVRSHSRMDFLRFGIARDWT
jgi:hypothetical protein